MEYKDYLQSNHWKQLKAKKKAIFLRKHKQLNCAICGSTTKYIDLHHMSYRHLFDVETTDLRFLCRICHAVFHDLKDKGKVKFKENASHHSKFAKTKHLVKVARGLLLKNKKGVVRHATEHVKLTGIQAALFHNIEL